MKESYTDRAKALEGLRRRRRIGTTPLPFQKPIGLRLNYRSLAGSAAPAMSGNSASKGQFELLFRLPGGNSGASLAAAFHGLASTDAAFPDCRMARRI